MFAFLFQRARGIVLSARALCACVVLVPALAPAQPTRGRDVLLTVGNHRIQGSTFRFVSGLSLDALVTSHVVSTSTWSLLAAGGTSLIAGKMPECSVQPGKSECAPSGNFAALNALVGVQRSAGRVVARSYAGPSLHHGSGATSVGMQGRVALTASLPDGFGLGVTLRATRLSSHHDESLTLVSLGGSLMLW